MMTDYTRLNELLDKWNELTIKEKEAIQSGEWEKVHSFQSAKSELQMLLSIELPDHNEKQSDNRVSSPEWENILRKGRKLIEIETENKRLVDSIMERMKSEYQSAQKNIKNLRKIHSAYGSKNLPSWQTYT